MLCRMSSRERGCQRDCFRLLHRKHLKLGESLHFQPLHKKSELEIGKSVTTGNRTSVCSARKIKVGQNENRKLLGLQASNEHAQNKVCFQERDAKMANEGAGVSQEKREILGVLLTLHATQSNVGPYKADKVVAARPHCALPVPLHPPE